MILASFTHDPDAVLDYSIDWTSWLNGENLTKSDWIAPSGIEITKPEVNSFTSTSTKVWISGGTIGQTYEVVNSIEAGDLKTDRTIAFCIQEK